MAFTPIQTQDFKLAGAGVTAIATSVTLTTFKYPDGTNIVTADLGGTGFGVFEPGSDREESFSFTTITQNANGTATLTGVTRGLKFKSPYDQDTALRQAHAGGSLTRLSNTGAFYGGFSIQSNDETITGIWTFTDPNVPRMNTAHTYLAGEDEYFATKRYVDGVAVSGAPDMNTTTKGIAEEATTAETDAGTGTGGTGARLAVNPAGLAASIYNTQLPSSGQKSALAGSSGTPGVANRYITEDDVSAAAASGKVVRATGTALPALDGGNLTNVQASAVSLSSYIAGEAITAGDVVCLVQDLAQTIGGSDNGITTGGCVAPFGQLSANSEREAIRFIPSTTSTVTSIDVMLAKTGTPADNVLVDIQTDSAGSPSGTPITNGTTTGIAGAGIATTIAAFSPTFAVAPTITAGTTYWLVFRRSGALSGTDYFNVGSQKTTTVNYGSFSGKTFTSSAWAASTSLVTFVMTLATGAHSARAWKADCDFRGLIDVIGIAKANASAGAAVTVQTHGYSTVLSGLTPGADYYVSGTAGGLTTNVPSFGSEQVAVRVGRAFSATTLLIDSSFQKEIIYQGNGLTTTVTVMIPCGFLPKTIEAFSSAAISNGHTISAGFAGGGYPRNITYSGVAAGQDGTTGTGVMLTTLLYSSTDNAGATQNNGTIPNGGSGITGNPYLKSLVLTHTRSAGTLTSFVAIKIKSY